MGYVHNDLKLENIVVGKDDPNLIYLIDFGLSSSYLDSNQEHILRTKHKRFFGNILYASLSAFSGISRSRRDDLQSVMYIMVFLLNANKLPWNDLSSKFPNFDRDFNLVLKERLNFEYT
jgi:serine/threonine protein kinase